MLSIYKNKQRWRHPGEKALREVLYNPQLDQHERRSYLKEVVDKKSTVCASIALLRCKNLPSDIQDELVLVIRRLQNLKASHEVLSQCQTLTRGQAAFLVYVIVKKLRSNARRSSFSDRTPEYYAANLIKYRSDVLGQELSNRLNKALIESRERVRPLS